MAGRTAILVVNGFDRVGLYGTTYDAADATRFPWIDVCLREIERRSQGGEHEVFVWDNSHLTELRDTVRRHGARLFPADEEISDQLVLRHEKALEALWAQVDESFDFVVTLDSDAFPVADGWLAQLHANLEATSLTGVWRDEMPGELSPFVHPSGLCIRAERLRLIEAPFSLRGVQSIGQRMTHEILVAGERIMPLRRSNRRNAHFLMAGVYGDLIYHHGAGSRAPLFRMTEGEEREARIYARLRDLVFTDLDRLLAVLRGESDEDLGLDWERVEPSRWTSERWKGTSFRETPGGDGSLSPPEATWLDELPAELAGHARILRDLLALARYDPRMRALQVQGSVGRGTSDALSDLDVGLVVSDDAWPVITGEMPTLVRKLGQVVDDNYHFLPNPQAAEVFKVWAHFGGGIQLDLLLLPASRLLGSGPDGRTLLDRDGLLARTDHPMRLSEPADIADWAFLSWQNLTEVAKYLERGLAAAAAEWLNSARQATISCWAAAHGVEYAGFANVAVARLGVSAPWPEGLEKAYPGPDAAAVLAAALALVEVQERADRLLETRLGIPPRPLALWVRTKLELLREDFPSPDSLPGRRTPRER